MVSGIIISDNQLDDEFFMKFKNKLLKRVSILLLMSGAV